MRVQPVTRASRVSLLRSKSGPCGGYRNSVPGKSCRLTWLGLAAFAKQKQAVGGAGHKKTKLLLMAWFLVEQLGARLAVALLELGYPRVRSGIIGTDALLDLHSVKKQFTFLVVLHRILNDSEVYFLQTERLKCLERYDNEHLANLLLYHHGLEQQNVLEDYARYPVYKL